jgi:hypothetical protein
MAYKMDFGKRKVVGDIEVGEVANECRLFLVESVTCVVSIR